MEAIPRTAPLSDTKNNVTFSTLESGFGFPSRLGFDSLYFTKIATPILVIFISCGHMSKI